MGLRLRALLAVLIVGIGTSAAYTANTRAVVAPTPPAAAPTAGATPAAPAAVGPGTQGWQLDPPGPADAIEGFADHAGVLPGQPVRLFVSTTAPGFTVTAFRFGHYTDSDAKAVWTSSHQPGHQQAAAVVQEPTHTVVAPWTPSLTVDTTGWAPGDYLLRLEADGRVAQRYVPLTVRTPSNLGRVVLVNAVTTWQAYNLWGGYDLYKGPDGQRATRSRAVSFDRPYSAEMDGAGQFLQFELGALRVAERAGVQLGYATDVELHADPALLDGARAVIFMGHDEYWSSAMRASADAARDQGTNLAFLGGNEDYRHIRFGPTLLGENRLEINYKSFDEDPVHLTNPDEATQDWHLPPKPRPESALIGNHYSCFPGRADLVAVDSSNWLLKGLVRTGQRFRGVVGIEYSHVDLSVPTPRPIEVLFHSPVVCGTTKKADFADATYYTGKTGAGVFSSGTMDWTCGMAPECQWGQEQNGGVARTLSAVTTRLIQEFAAGPAGREHPVNDNVAALGITSAHAAPPAVDDD